MTDEADKPAPPPASGMSPAEFKQHKDIQYFGASVNAWLNWSLELDKSLLALSAGAIGLLVTLLTAKVGADNVVLLVLYIVTMATFLVCVVSVLLGLHKSKVFIGNLARDLPPGESMLDAIDAVSRLSFGIGALLLTIIGVSTAVLLHTEKGAQVSNERMTKDVTPGYGKSASGFEALKPVPVPTQGSGQGQPTGPAPAQTQQSTTGGSAPSSGTK